MTDHTHGGSKRSDQNAKLDTANCAGCGRRKRTAKLAMTRVGWVCRRCISRLTENVERVQRSR